MHLAGYDCWRSRTPFNSNAMRFMCSTTAPRPAFRLAMAHPERVTAIVSQNGNAYEEGLGDAWGPIRKYWAEPTAENREVIRKNILTLEGTRWQYTHGVNDPESVAPESYTLDTALLERPGTKIFSSICFWITHRM